MTQEEVNVQCVRYGIPQVEKQITNIQNIIHFLNKEEKRLATEGQQAKEYNQFTQKQKGMLMSETRINQSDINSSILDKQEGFEIKHRSTPNFGYQNKDTQAKTFADLPQDMNEKLQTDLERKNFIPLEQQQSQIQSKAQHQKQYSRSLQSAKSSIKTGLLSQPHLELSQELNSVSQTPSQDVFNVNLPSRIQQEAKKQLSSDLDRILRHKKTTSTQQARRSIPQDYNENDLKLFNSEATEKILEEVRVAQPYNIFNIFRGANELLGIQRDSSFQITQKLKQNQSNIQTEKEGEFQLLFDQIFKLDNLQITQKLQQILQNIAMGDEKVLKKLPNFLKDSKNQYQLYHLLKLQEDNFFVTNFDFIYNIFNNLSLVVHGFGQNKSSGENKKQQEQTKDFKDHIVPKLVLNSFMSKIIQKDIYSNLGPESQELLLKTHQKVQKIEDQVSKYSFAFTSENLQLLNTTSKLALLEGALQKPPKKSHQTNLKSIHYILLDSILDDYIKYQENLSKEQLFYVIKRCLEIYKNKELQNKLTSALDHSDVYDQLNNDEIFELIKTFNDHDKHHQKKNSKDSTLKTQYIDSKAIIQLLRSRSKANLSHPQIQEPSSQQQEGKRLKFSQQLCHIEDLEGFKELITLYEMVFEQYPLAWKYNGSAFNQYINSGQNNGHLIRYAQSQGVRLNSKFNIDLQDQLNFALMFVSHSYRPTFFFPEILSNKRQSFGNPSEVKPELIEQLVEKIIIRSEQDKFLFDQMLISTSLIHKNFFKFDELTFKMIQRITNDIIEISKMENRQIGIQYLNILSQMYSAEYIVKTYFDDHQSIIHTYGAIIPQYRAYFSQQTESKQLANEMNLKNWMNFFQFIHQAQRISTTFHDDLKADLQSIFRQGLEVFEADIQNNAAQSQFQFNLSDFMNIYKQISVLNKSFPQKDSDQQLLKGIFRAIFKTHILNNQDIEKNQAGLKLPVPLNQEAHSFITQQISDSNRSVIYRDVAALLAYMDSDNNLCQDISTCLNFIKNIPNVRSLKSDDLKLLFEIVQNLSQQQIKSKNIDAQISSQQKVFKDTEKILMLAASNLETLRSAQFNVQVQENQLGEEMKDKMIENLNQDIINLDKKTIKMVIQTYTDLYQNDSHIFQQEIKKPFNLQPLSGLMADELENMSHNQVLLCMKILNSEDLNAYDEQFLQKLHDRYTQENEISSMKKQGNSFFLDFAQSWPMFLHNQLLIEGLIQIGQKNFVKEQSLALKILAINKNIMHPQLLVRHFETFQKMKDKDTVKEILAKFIQTCSYVGYTEQIDMLKLTQIFRRINKDVREIKDISLVLDFMIMIALSNCGYKEEFDAKSAKYIEDALDYIDEYFKGTLVTQQQIQNQTNNGDQKNPEKVDINYFSSFKSENKTFNKKMLRKTLPIIQHCQLDENFPTLSTQQQNFNKSTKQKNETSIKISNTNRNKLPQQSEYDEEDQQINEEIEVDKFDEDQYAQFQIKQAIQEQEFKRNSFVLVDEKDQEDKAEQENLDGDADQEQGIKMYDFKSREGQQSEELKYQTQRKKQLAQLGKKARHLLLFTNYDQLNFVNINNDDAVKAWVVLFHFRSKSLDSLLYEDFLTPVYRNSLNKSVGHQAFSSFYRTMTKYSYENRYQMSLSKSCDKTGWPIDVQIIKSKLHEDNWSKNSASEEMALYFLLQGETCHNVTTGKEEPLAVQKLMLKHVRNIRDVHVNYVGENQYYQVSLGDEEVQQAFAKSLFQALEQ